MAWIVLFLAGLLEVGWAVGLKYSEGFTKPIPSIFTAAAMLASVLLLGIAMRTLPLGTAYAIWTGIGTIGAVIAGMVLFQDPATPLRLLCILLIAAGIGGLKLLT